MANKSKQDLKNEFKEDYKNAISFYLENDLIHFNRDIRVAIENFCRLLISDIIGEQRYHEIEDNLKFIDPSGRLVPQNPGYTVESSGWIKNAKNALNSLPAYSRTDNHHKNIKKRVEASFEQLNAQYGETSETSQHSGSDQDPERMRYQADLCIATFPALFQSLKEYITKDLDSFLTSLPKASDSSKNAVAMSSVILEKETALSALDEYTQGFQRQGGVKFIAILPENASSILGKNRLSAFFKIKWSLVIDFNPDDTSTDTLFASAPSKSTSIITDAITVTDGSDLTNWMFAKGRKSLRVLSGTELLRKFPSEFKQVFSQMAKAGSTDDYVIVSFCDSQEATQVLTKAFDKLEDVFNGWDSVEQRCRIVCLSKNLDFSDRIESWGEGIAFLPHIVPADIRDFINHIEWRMPSIKTASPNGHILIRGKSLDVSDDINRYKAAGIEFFGPHMADTTSSSIWDFYSGAEINWHELENDCDAKRDLYIKVKNRITDIIKNNRINVRVFTLKHRPGSGGSTMARRLAYDIYKEDDAELLSCVPLLIKSSKNIKDTAEYLSKLSENIGNACILAIVESKSVGRSDFDNLVQKLARAKKRVVFFYIESTSMRFDDTKSDVAFLDDVLKGDESRFVAKYKAQGLSETAIDEAREERRNHSLEVIDFPLLLKEDMSSESLSSYVAEWMENLPNSIKEFVGFVGFVAHYSQMGLNQNLVRATWYDPSSNHYTLKGYDHSVMSAIYKLLIEEYSGDEALGIWRPRYNKFSIHLIKATWGDNWKNRLPEIAKKFIFYCAQSGQLGDEDQDMLHSLFIIRRDIDFRAEDVVRKNKFALLINDLEDPERAASIFKCLVDAYPGDAVFHGHFARFLYEKASAPSTNILADDKLFHDAQDQLDIAFEISPNDADLCHMQGMLIRRQLSALRKEFERSENRSTDFIDEIHSTMTDWVSEAVAAFDRSIEFDPSSPYGYAASCQLFREAIEFGRILLQVDDFSFCDKEPQYSEYVDELGYRLDQFEQVCYSFKENALAQITPSLKIYNDVRLFHRDLIGCGGGSIIKYRDLYSSSSGEMKGIYGDFLVKSILYSKTNTKDYKTAYKYLKEDERKEIEQVLQQKRSEGDLRCYDSLFKLYRYGKKEYPIDSAIDLLRDCESQYQSSEQKGWGYLNACYYLAVCYSALAIHGKELSSELVNNARKYFDEATKLANIFEKSTINSFCYLGEKKDIHCIVDKESDGMPVSGIIISIDNNKGIMRMRCGLEASFNAKGMDKFKYQGKSIQGIIGFKYSGLGLYQFGETENEESTEEEIEEIINNTYVPDYTDEEVNDNATDETSTPAGLTVLGKIELPADTKRLDVKHSDRTYRGVYDKSTESVTCSSLRYPLKVRSKDENDIYDGADVLFEIGSEPHHKDPNKTYLFAINVRIKS